MDWDQVWVTDSKVKTNHFVKHTFFYKFKTTTWLFFWDILDEFIDEREKEMSELVNLINVSKATNSKIKFPYWKLPITTDKTVHLSPYETYLEDTYNNFCHDLNGKSHNTTTVLTSSVIIATSEFI